MKFEELVTQLESSIQKTYEDGVTVEEAEKLAAKFLYAQLAVSGELKKTSLDARMRKSGLKAIRAGLYLDEVKKNDKKPTEAQLSALLDSHDIVQTEQSGLDEAETSQANLERYYDIFGNGHIYFRTIAKGRFE